MSFSYLNSAKKIICIGRNYAAHIKELGNTASEEPFFFLKPSSSIVTPEGFGRNRLADTGFSFRGLNEDGTNPGKIMIPRGVTVHHEVELALVMDDYVSNLREDALKASDVYKRIRGVALALDLTARNVQAEAKRKGLPWTIGKGFDTFLPIGPMIPRTEFESSSSNLQGSFNLKCIVNSEKRQDGSTSLMLFPMHKILQHISTIISLEPGDIVLTGTPAGVGPLVPGDRVQAQLYNGAVMISSLDFDCIQRPGPYEYGQL